MQQWEFLFVDLEYEGYTWFVTYISDESVKDWGNDTTEHEISNNLGKQGWEMFSYSSPHRNLEYTQATSSMAFKRLKG